MTVRQKFEEMLKERGMSNIQAQMVMDAAIPLINESDESYYFTFDSPSEEYPNMIYRLLFDGMIKSIALNWIEENVPMAWYKPMFV